MPDGPARLTIAAALLAVLAPAPALPQSAPATQSVPLAERVAARLAEAGPGTRFGLVVIDEDGRELIALDPDGRFIPGSNTKMAVTAAAMMMLSGTPGAAGPGTRVRLTEGRTPDVVIEGRGDPWLSTAANCARDCLATLADAVAARTRRVHDVIGDATWFADERWPSGMSWNNIPTRSGTAIGALSADDNELVYTLTPDPDSTRTRIEGPDYLTIDNRVATIPDRDGTDPALALELFRAPMSREAVLTGELAVGSGPVVVRDGIDDPARYVAWSLAKMLRERGVRVTGEARSRYRVPGDAPPAEPASPPLAVLTPSPLGEAVARIMKPSQNHHADVLLRRLGRASGGDGTAEAGQAVIGRMFAEAGVPESGYFFADGSGMSTYNRMSPRGTVRLLQWIARQPWAAAWQESLPIAGRDGTLANRFRGTALEGRLFAKTGSLNATNALSGWLLTRSGKRLTFALFANDVPPGTSALPAMDAALVLVAED